MRCCRRIGASWTAHGTAFTFMSYPSMSHPSSHTGPIGFEESQFWEIASRRNASNRGPNRETELPKVNLARVWLMSSWPQFVSTFFRTFAMTKGQAKKKPSLFGRRWCLLADCAINRSCQRNWHADSAAPRRISRRHRRRSGRLAVGMGVKVRWFLYHLRIPMLYVPSQSKPPPISRTLGWDQFWTRLF